MKPSTLEQIKYVAIYEAMERNGFNKTWAAKELGISIRGLRILCRKFDIVQVFKKERELPCKQCSS